MPTFLPPWLWLTGCLLLALLLALLLGLTLRLVPGWPRHDRRRDLLAQLAERERLACEVHDALLQGMQGILLSFQSVGQRLPPGSAERAAIEHLLDQGDAALADGRQRLQALRPLAGPGAKKAD